MLTAKSQADHASRGVVNLTRGRERARNHCYSAVCVAGISIEIPATVSTGTSPVIRPFHLCCFHLFWTRARRCLSKNCVHFIL